MKKTVRILINKSKKLYKDLLKQGFEKGLIKTAK